MNLTLNSVPQKTPDTVFRIIDEETVIVEPRKGMVTVINAVGSRIWELIDEKRTINNIVDIISTEYDIQPEEAKKDTLSFLRDLSEKDMISLS